MLGLLGILFFAMTGLMLNHEEWFNLAVPRLRKANGLIPPALLKEPDRLAIVEKLRKDFRAAGAVDSFETQEDQISVIFKGPARRVQAIINRPDGRVEVTHESRNIAARFTELHRGTEAGFAWRLIIDVVAGVQIFSALTGILLWWLVPKWRPLGLAALAVCVIVCGLVYLLLVP
jgi:hypothetical protein